MYFICLRIYKPTNIVGLQAAGKQMQRSIEQMQRSIEELKLEKDKEREGKHPVDEF